MMSDQPDNKQSPEYQLLQRIDQRLENIEGQIEQVESRAIKYGVAAGAASGALAGGLVAVGVLAAKIKLGI